MQAGHPESAPGGPQAAAPIRVCSLLSLLVQPSFALDDGELILTEFGGLDFTALCVCVFSERGNSEGCKPTNASVMRAPECDKQA